MTATGALQQALELEHQVVYGYGVVGAQLSGPPRRLAAERLAAHQLARDRLATLLRRNGRRPAPGRPAYGLPFPVTDATAALRLAAALEDAAAGAAWDLTAATGPRTTSRQLGVTALADAATAAARWRLLVPGSLDPALPGQPEPASQPSTTPTISPSSSTSASGTTS